MKKGWFKKDTVHYDSLKPEAECLCSYIVQLYSSQSFKDSPGRDNNFDVWIKSLDVSVVRMLLRLTGNWPMKMNGI